MRGGGGARGVLNVWGGRLQGGELQDGGLRWVCGEYEVSRGGSTQGVEGWQGRWGHCWRDGRGERGAEKWC